MKETKNDQINCVDIKQHLSEMGFACDRIRRQGDELIFSNIRESTQQLTHRLSCTISQCVATRNGGIATSKGITTLTIYVDYLDEFLQLLRPDSLKTLNYAELKAKVRCVLVELGCDVVDLQIEGGSNIIAFKLGKTTPALSNTQLIDHSEHGECHQLLSRTEDINDWLDSMITNYSQRVITPDGTKFTPGGGSLLQYDTTISNIRLHRSCVMINTLLELESQPRRWLFDLIHKCGASYETVVDHIPGGGCCGNLVLTYVAYAKLVKVAEEWSANRPCNSVIIDASCMLADLGETTLSCSGDRMEVTIITKKFPCVVGLNPLVAAICEHPHAKHDIVSGEPVVLEAPIGVWVECIKKVEKPEILEGDPRDKLMGSISDKLTAICGVTVKSLTVHDGVIRALMNCPYPSTLGVYSSEITSLLEIPGVQIFLPNAHEEFCMSSQTGVKCTVDALCSGTCSNRMILID